MSDPEFSLEDVARYWDDNAAAWAREVGQGHDFARDLLNNPAFLALIGDLRGRQVLDAGCGDGYNTRILARAGAHMSGVDLSARMIELAQEEERRAPLGIRYARASYIDLALFTGASFDAVVSFMALMDGPRFDRAVAGRGPLLRPGPLGGALPLHGRAARGPRVRRAPLRPHALRVRQHADRGGIRAEAARGAAPVGGVLPGPPRPARVA
jgi:SAM-dependent methyltransferase